MQRKGRGEAPALAGRAKKSPVVKPGFKRIPETGVSRGSKETTRALHTGFVLQRMDGLSGYSLKAA